VVAEALLRRRRRVHRIWLDAAARIDERLSEILALAEKAGAKVERVERHQLDRMSQTGVHNGIIAEAEGLEQPSVKEVIDRVREPFFVLVDEVQYEHNLGAILRSALGAGVDAVVIPTERGKGLTPVVQRVAMGGAEAVPVIREGLSSALATMQRAGIRIVGADMEGAPLWDVDLTGPLAMVLGGEDKGLTPALQKRCDAIAAIPLAGNLQSLNVSVSAALVMFERVRQGRGG
jgi:23S rRNA (guanosine2251-2'-O)-methyltransferase